MILRLLTNGWSRSYGYRIAGLLADAKIANRQGIGLGRLILNVPGDAARLLERAAEGFRPPPSKFVPGRADARSSNKFRLEET